MSATRTYQNITPAQAEKFLAGARGAGFKTRPELVDLSYHEPFQIVKEIALSTLGFMVQYDGSNETCVISLTDLPFFLDADTVMGRLDSYVAAAQSSGVMPKMTIWSNKVHTNHKVRKPRPPAFGIMAHDVPDYSRRPREFAQLYNFPLQFTGKGVTVALIELGGGLDDADMLAFGYDKPVARQFIDGATEQLDGADGAQGEVTLDTQVIADNAPEADIVLYFTPNTDSGFVDSINQAVKDILATKRPGVISISWGGPFDQFSEAAQMNLNAAINFAAANGIIVCVASGDSLADDGSDHAAPDCPACLQPSLAVGGTFKTADSETVWNRDGSGSGGGVCAYYPQNAWQGNLNYTTIGNPAQPLINRGSPDVSANADPESGYKVYVAGQWQVIGGTSGAAPLWASLIALILQAKFEKDGSTSLPNFQENIYSLAQTAETYAAILNDIAPPPEQNNSEYEVTPGWDPATGLGSPNGAGLLALFTGDQAANIHPIGN
jgi:kumamolisin